MVNKERCRRHLERRPSCSRARRRGCSTGWPGAARAGHAGPPDGARRARRARDRRRLRALQRRPGWLWAAARCSSCTGWATRWTARWPASGATERPTYGYYLDHLVDAVATAVIGIGLGLSPYMLLAVGFAIVVAYLVLSINTYLETQALGVFSLGYGRLGPTEARLGLIALTALALAGAGGDGRRSRRDAAGRGRPRVVALMLAGLSVRAARNLRTLALREPRPTPRRSARRAGPRPRTPRSCG